MRRSPARRPTGKPKLSRETTESVQKQVLDLLKHSQQQAMQSTFSLTYHSHAQHAHLPLVQSAPAPPDPVDPESSNAREPALKAATPKVPRGVVPKAVPVSKAVHKSIEHTEKIDERIEERTEAETRQEEVEAAPAEEILKDAAIAPNVLRVDSEEKTGGGESGNKVPNDSVSDDSDSDSESMKVVVIDDKGSDSDEDDKNNHEESEMAADYSDVDEQHQQSAGVIDAGK